MNGSMPGRPREVWSQLHSIENRYRIHVGRTTDMAGGGLVLNIVSLCQQELCRMRVCVIVPKDEVEDDEGQDNAEDTG